MNIRGRDDNSLSVGSPGGVYLVRLDETPRSCFDFLLYTVPIFAEEFPDNLQS